jgi:hypothetical protein
MPKRLNITNGDGAAGVIRASAVEGDILAWQDLMFEGPFPAGLDLEAASEQRAAYLATSYPSDRDTAAEFRQRDRQFSEAGRYDEIVLWFEHDLLDQLQLLQLLDVFAANRPDSLNLICIDDHPDVDEFRGLGQLLPKHLPALLDARMPVTETQFALAQAGWAAFRAPDPRAIESFLSGENSVLPFLAPALSRHLEEFPSSDTGLSRTDRQLLDLAAAGRGDPLTLFLDNMAQETCLFRGDWSTFRRLAALCDGPAPLLRSRSGGPFRFPPRDKIDIDLFRLQRLVLTTAGHEVLDGAADAAVLNPIDLWLGGVHLCAGAPLWRWDAGCGRLQETAPPIP